MIIEIVGAVCQYIIILFFSYILFSFPRGMWKREDNSKIWVVLFSPLPLGYSMHTSRFLLVPTRQRGNAVSHAPALRERDAGASRRHSHAGAWERDKSICCKVVCI